MKNIAMLVVAVTTFFSPLHAMADEIEAAIVVNQAGYHPDWPKRAMVMNKAGDEPIALINAENGELVQMYAAQDAVSGPENSTVQLLDLSAIKATGRFYLEGDDLRSATFNINKNTYKEATRLLLRSYYLQRCGHELRDEETGLSHQACHLDDGVYPRDDEVNKEGQHRDATGGWHDAGDYGKYIAPAAVTVNRLMSLYLMAPERYPDGALSIPESGNGQSDLLDELTIELDWMLKMQRSDGAVYRKVSGTKWTKAISPEDDKQTRYVYGVSSPETGKFISSMAMAARAFESSDKARAKRYLAAAEKSWEWLKYQLEQTIDWQKEDDSGSGAYISSDTDTEVQLDTDHDDRLTAAVELYLTTKQQEYREYIQAFEPEETYSLYEWKDASSLSLLHLMEQDKTPELKSVREDIQQKLIARADELYARVEASAFNIANDRFIWGSNKMTAEEGITLAHAWRLSGKKEYLNAAIDQLDYIMGRNPFNLSFVTAVGENAVKKPVHLFGRSIKRTLPGLMVGGPNAAAQDNIAPKDKGMMSYVDNERAYSVNEYAIDYNAALIGLLEVLAIYQQQMDESGDTTSSTTTDAATDDIAKKVLFIGNSFTYYNNSLHYHVEQLRRNTMSHKDFADYNFRAATIAGGYWFEQLTNVDSLTNKKGWNVVVMQGHSREAIDDSKRLSFKAALSESLTLLRERGIKPMLFMTWAYKHRPEMIKALEPRYIELAHELDVTLVPVGSAFARALELRPDLDLHAKDGIHPSRAGTYLAASVFYAMLYQESPVGLKYNMGLDVKDATFLQEIAHRTVAEVAELQSDFAQSNRLAMPDL
jgi:endoglucanase